MGERGDCTGGVRAMLSGDKIHIGGFDFEWILFEDLTGLTDERNNLSRFDCVKNRFGVYIFFDETKVVPYVGLCGKTLRQKQYMKVRIGQYFKHRQDTGNPFAKIWMDRNSKSYDDFKLYIGKCRLGTFSIDKNIHEPCLKELLGDKGGSRCYGEILDLYTYSYL